MYFFTIDSTAPDDSEVKLDLHVFPSPFKTSDNVTIHARGNLTVLDSDLVEYTSLQWLFNGRQKTSGLSDMKKFYHNGLLQISQSMSVTNADFENAGVVEVFVVVDSYIYLSSCRSYYNKFISASNFFGDRHVILAHTAAQLQYYGQFHEFYRLLHRTCRAIYYANYHMCSTFESC